MKHSTLFNFRKKIGLPFFALSTLSLFLIAAIGSTLASSYFADDFNDGVRDTSKWKIGVLTRDSSHLDSNVRVSEQNGHLVIVPRAGVSTSDFSGYVSVIATDLTNAQAAVEVVEKADSTAQTIFSVGIDKNNFYRFRAKGKTLYLENATNGSVSTNSILFDPLKHRVWRFRHVPEKNTVVLETSADGKIWSSRKSVRLTFSLTSLFVELNAGTTDSVSVPGSARFDNFRTASNVATSPSPSPTASPTPSPSPTASPTPTPSPSPTASPTPTPTTSNVRGYLTTPGELRVIRQKADQQMQPYKASYDSLMSYLGSPTNWPHRDFTGVDVCTDRDSFQDAAARVYGMTLAYHLTGNEQWAIEARKHILEMARSKTVDYLYSGSGLGCPLTMARHTPGYVVAADLLADYSGWTAADKALFLDWLNNHAYHLVDWANDARSTNWGSNGSNAAGIIADYFAGSGRNLRDRNGQWWTPRQAYEEAKSLQLHRMNGTSDHSTGLPFPGMKNSVCQNFLPTSSTNGYAHGIQVYGGIPEETGRGTTGCTGTQILDADSAWSYMHTTLTSFVMQAEMLLRRGDSSMYDNMMADGRGSMQKAMEFTLTPFGAHSSRTSIFELGYRYYRNPLIGNAIGVGGSRRIAGASNSVFLHFGTLTHGFALNENPGRPPTVPAP